MRHAIGFAWRRRYLTVALLAVIVTGVVAIGAVANSSRTGNIKVLGVAATTDSCGYVIANSTAFPRGATAFNESTVLKGFSPVNAAALGDKVIAYYSDEHALTLGGAGAAASPLAQTTGSDLTTTSSSFGAQTKDPSARPLQPILYVTEISSAGQKSSPQSGDWQASGQVGNEFTNGFSPSEIHGSFKPANAVDPKKNSVAPQLGSLGNWPSGLQNEGFTAAIVWNTADLNLQPGKIYKLQFMVHDGDQNKAGGDVGEGCTAAFTPGLTTTATGGTFSATGTLSVSDKVTISGVSPTATGKVTVKAYGPASSSTDCSTLLSSQDLTLTQVNGDVNHDYTANFPVTQKGDYNFTADLFLGNSNTASASSPCGAPNEKATALPRPTTMTTNAGTTFKVGAGGTVALTDTATLSGGTSDASGTISFELFKGACPGTSQGTASPVTTVNGADGKQYTSSSITVGPGQYHWVATYTGDGNKNDGTATTCGDANENPLVINPAIDVKKEPANQSVASGGTANFTITVKNIGDSRLTDIVTGDVLAPDCVRDATATAALETAQVGHAWLDPNESFTYPCSLANVTQPFVNVITACGNPPVGSQVCDTDNNGGNPPPGCIATEANRCAGVGIETLASKQDFAPNDGGTVTVTAPGAAPNGKLRFQLYKGDCSVPGNLIFDSGAITVDANGNANTSNALFLSALLANAGLNTNTAGTYNWQINYSGDTNGNPDITGACGTEHFTVTNS